MLIANWKSNGSRKMAINWFDKFFENYSSKNIETFIGIAPPSVYIDQINNLKKPHINIGLQDIDSFSGARTGSISADMAIDFGCKFSIIGHSERRDLYKETNDQIKEKIVNLNKKIIPILCVGETKKENIEGQTKNILQTQLEIIKNYELHELFAVAYEPVWAIGSGNTPHPEEINEIHKFIKDVVQSHSTNNLVPDVLYGGSVTDKNARSFFNQEFVDGALIGGASLDGLIFAEIVNIFNGTLDR
jgi:triosephosphate isomerase